MTEQDPRKHTPTEPAQRPYTPPALADEGPLAVQLAELRVLVSRIDRDVHELHGARHRSVAREARIEERVAQVQARLPALDRLEEGLARLEQQQAHLERRLAAVGGLMGAGLLGGQLLLRVLGIG